MTILIISEPDDVHAYAVFNALKRRDQSDVHLFDYEQFPARINLDIALSARDSSHYRIWLAQDKFIDREAVRAIWWRRPINSGYQALNGNSAEHVSARTDSLMTIQGIWQAGSCLWVNDIARAAAIRHKPWQLDLAKQCGLTIPETLITTIPEHAQQFWQQHYGQITCQLLQQACAETHESRKVEWKELTDIDSSKLAQIIFQELVPGTADLRITIIGNEILSAALDLLPSDNLLCAQPNRRIYQRHELPVDMQHKLLLMMRRSGLEYGVIDMRLRPDGEYVFLGIDPYGHFLFVEHACQLPISDLLAKHLAQGKGSTAIPLAAQKAA
ncbi:hypothetical protein ABF87_06985 [Nitrosomonas sp. JL21]|uniref:MvdC/MvdD family ATP grasp protein n=1 Tax=Nitrosomonas sp. JL21 TaxID=153949 RepID=UPI0013691FC6|nr:hypothetical protein [Nitrosomonas sp. JL21]MBL8498252.1 hypothetical protein [Nitrosomonas sp.]MCC7092378.1 hypothetical protein [Nitrosomonas sp.]MXS77716.1 hypothetical protein [Nitrosomonas sp. JL21]